MTNGYVEAAYDYPNSSYLRKFDSVYTIKVRGIEIPLYKFIEKFLYIRALNEETGEEETMPFILNSSQCEFYAKMCEMKLKGLPVRIDTLKARQLGLSTLIASIFFCYGMFKPNTRWCVLADQKDHASNIFKMYDTFYKNLNLSLPNYQEIEDYPKYHNGAKHPDDLRPALSSVRSGLSMTTLNGNSTIEVIVAGDSAGRSATYTGVHSSETAFQKNLLNTNISLFSTVSIKNKNSLIFIETTANGFNSYKDLWDRDASGRSAFRAVFFPWYNNPLYSIDATEHTATIDKIPQWIHEKWKQHPKVSVNKVLWYYTVFSQGYTKDKMLQEYPWDPSDSFVASGHSIFEQEKLQKRKNEIISLPYIKGTFAYNASMSQDETTLSFQLKGFVEDYSGSWKVFIKPKPNTHYVAICDANKGTGLDDSAIQVLEQNTGIQCAVYKNKNDRISEVANQLLAAGIYYNMALLSPENNTGPSIIERLVKASYPKIYQTQQLVADDINQSLSRGFGHSTNIATRPKFIRDFEDNFALNPNIINDYDTIVQMEAFQNVVNKTTGNVKAQGVGCHDDLVMAYAPFWTIRIQQDFDIMTSVDNKTTNVSLSELNKQVYLNNRSIDNEYSKRKSTRIKLRL